MDGVRAWIARSPILAGMFQRSKYTAADVLKNPKWPESWPYSPADFRRQDEQDDGVFYDSPRLVFHIDEFAISALTKFYARTFPPKADILDICSSWVSHFPEGYEGGRVAGLGMNEFELKKNPVLTEYSVQNLNIHPHFPYPDNSFDVITNVVSVDYLNQPLEVFKEMNRVLRPGGTAIMSFSNRCFPTKAIGLWLSTNDMEHVFIVGSYFHYAGGYDKPTAVDLSPTPGITDPMYVVMATKSAN